MNNEQIEVICKRAERAAESGPGSSEDTQMMVRARTDIPALLAEVEKLNAQLDELIGSVHENCNRHSAPYTLADSIEWGNTNVNEEI